MKTATFLAALLGAASLVSAQVKDITPDEMEDFAAWAEDLEKDSPECFNKCMNDANISGEDVSDLAPPCAISDQDAEDAEMISYQNGMDCLCADRIWQSKLLECAIKTCKGADAQPGFDLALTNMYGMCALYTSQRWPKPAVVLDELCLSDDVPSNVEVPETVPYFDVENAPQRLRDYEFADEWPEQTATTWAPNGTPIPETREPLECMADKGVDGKDEEVEVSGTATGGAGKPTGTGSAEEEEEKEEEGEGDEEGAAVRGVVSAVLLVVAGAVGGLAIVL